MATMTQEDRDAKRAERIEQADRLLADMLSQEGFTRWLELRRNFHSFSWGNQALIIQGAYEQAMGLGNIETPCAFPPTIVKSAGRWKKDGYHPARGTRGLIIWAFSSRKRKDGTWTCCGATLTTRKCPACGKDDHYFKLAPVFDASQVRSFEDGTQPAPPVIETVPMDGYDKAWLMPALAGRAMRADLCKMVTFACDPPPEMQGAGGWCTREREVFVCDRNGDRAIPGNQQLGTLIHELGHAIRFDDGVELLSYADEEVIVECAAYAVCAAIGLDRSGFSIPYLASWARDTDKVKAVTAAIDSTAKLIETELFALLDPQEDETDA